MDACDGPRADVIDQVAEHDAVHECGPQVFMQADLESHLDALRGQGREPVAIGQQKVKYSHEHL